MFRVVNRLVREDDGVELVELSFLGVIFAFAAALLWSKRAGLHFRLESFGDCITYNRCR
jgi:hypothetical protein